MSIMNLENRNTQLAISILPFILITAAFPVATWFVVISISHAIELATGYHAPLVGKPGGIDPGAIIVLGIYLVLGAAISYFSYLKNLKICSAIVGAGSLLSSPYIFAMVSSVIWF